MIMKFNSVWIELYFELSALRFLYATLYLCTVFILGSACAVELAPRASDVDNVQF